MTVASNATPARAPAERALAIVRASNRALIRSADESALLDRVCRIAVELGDHRLAWVGYAEDDPGRTVRPVAFAGEESGYLSAIRLSWAEEEFGRGPCGVAIRSGQACVQRVTDDPAFSPWRSEAAQRGFATVLALPLREGDRTFGVLALYAADPDAFGSAEVDLLSELSDDLGFGIVTLRLRAERERLAAVVEQAVDPTILVDAERRVSYVNPAFLAATNRSAADVVGRPTRSSPRRSWAPIAPRPCWRPPTRDAPGTVSSNGRARTARCATLRSPSCRSMTSEGRSRARSS